MKAQLKQFGLLLLLVVVCLFVWGFWPTNSVALVSMAQSHTSATAASTPKPVALPASKATAVVEAPKAKAVDPAVISDQEITFYPPVAPSAGFSLSSLSADPANWRLEPPLVDDSKGAILGNVTLALNVTRKFTTTSGKNLFFTAYTGSNGETWLSIDILVPDDNGGRGSHLDTRPYIAGQHISIGPSATGYVPHIEMIPQM